MPQKAHVTSVEALEAFRSSLIVYVSKARPTLEEVTADVLRTRLWLETEQRTHWEGQLRRRTKELEQAQAALFSARISNLSDAISTEQLAFHRAKRAFDEAEAKLRVLKQWNREFENRVDPLVKQTEKLHTVLANDMIKAIAYLTEAIKTLAAYSEIGPRPASSIPATGPSQTAAQPAEPGEKKVAA